MPQERQPDNKQFLDLDSEDFKFAQEQISDLYALNLVQQLFPLSEAYRSTASHDQRWNTNDSLFCGWKDMKVWEGTNIPRASLGIPIVFDQIEAAVPAIYNALFGIGPEWFSVDAEPGTNPQEARALQATMSYILEHCRDNYSGSAKAEINLAIIDMCLRGNGGIELGFDPLQRRPYIKWVDIRDFYIDPGCNTPDIEDCRWVFRRKLMTVEELESLRGSQGMDIPEKPVLQALAKDGPPFVIADQTKRMQEAFRGIQYQPNSSDYTPVPMDRKIEVLVYYSKTRIIWVLNRKVVVYNAANPYNFFPFAFAPYYIFISRFYGLSIADVQEGNQRYIEALINGRLDELSLAIRPPRIAKRGILMTPSQQRWHPGMVYQAEDPKHMELFQPQNALANIYAEVEYFERASEKRTGINSMAQGVPRGGNVNRTATGVQSQMQGANNKLQSIVSNIEDYLILPMLYKLYKLIQFHMNPEETLPAQTVFGNFGKVPASLYSKPIKFRMNASSRMVTKAELQQVFPFMAQYLLNGQFLGMLEQTGKTVNFPEFFEMFQDSTGVSKRYNLIRDITEQEMQQKQQQQEQNPETQKMKMDFEARKYAVDKDYEVKKEKNQIDAQKGGPDPMEMQLEQMKAQLEMEKMKVEILMMEKESQIKQQHDMQMARIKQNAAQMDMVTKQKQAEVEGQIKSQELAGKMKAAMMDSQIKLRTSEQQAQLAQIQGEQSLRQNEELHQQSLKHGEASGQQKLKMTGEQGKQNLQLKKEESKIKTKVMKDKSNSKPKK